MRKTWVFRDPRIGYALDDLISSIEDLFDGNMRGYIMHGHNPDGCMYIRYNPGQQGLSCGLASVETAENMSLIASVVIDRFSEKQDVIYSLLEQFDDWNPKRVNGLIWV